MVLLTLGVCCNRLIICFPQVPRTEGNEKGKGNYWTFATGCESMLDLFENGNFRRRRPDAT